MSRIQVKGRAFREVENDIMIIKIDFQARSLNQKEASEKVRQSCEDFLSKLTDINSELMEFVQLKEERIYANTYDGQIKYTVERGISFRILFDMRSLLVIRKILSDGEYEASFSVDYAFSKEAEVEAELLAEALLNSKETAEEMGASLGKHVLDLDNMELEKKKPHSNLGGDCDILGYDDPFANVFGSLFQENLNSINIKAPTYVIEKSVEATWIIA